MAKTQTPARPEWVRSWLLTRDWLWGLARRWWPLIAASLLLIVSLESTIRQARALTGSDLVYPLDDAYIHMSMARNFADYGVWGITRFAYSASTSSPLWTYLLSVVDLVFGARVDTPLLLNLAFALLLLAFADGLLRRSDMPAPYRFGALFALVYYVPFTVMVFSGMEHTLHSLMTLVFTAQAADRLAQPGGRRRDQIALAALGMLLVTVRYEGVLLLSVVGLLFVLRGRWRDVLWLVGLSVLPLVVYGLVAVANGWFFLPASIMMKSEARTVAGMSLPRLITHLVDTFHVLRSYPVFVSMVVGGLFVLLWRYRQQRTWWDQTSIILAAFILVTPPHIRFVRYVGPLLRYEYYLLCLGIVALALSAGDYVPRRLAGLRREVIPVYAAAGLAAALLLYPLVDRLRTSVSVVNASTNVYHQQIQMAHFLREFYQGQPVVANDIGAITYFADIKLIDLVGLGTVEVTRARAADTFNTAVMQALVQGQDGKIAVIYESWYAPVPEEWVLVGRWKTVNNVILGSDTVSFYAVDPTAANLLESQLRRYSPSLPAGVMEAGAYTEP